MAKLQFGIWRQEMTKRAHHYQASRFGAETYQDFGHSTMDGKERSELGK
jgi:hypothetical protein